MLFFGRLSEGKISCSAEIADHLKSLKEGRICIDIKRGPKRSLLQNNYYRLIMEFIGNEFGNSKDEMHDFFKAEFLKEDVYMEGINRTVTRIKESKDLTTKEFGEYMNNIIIRCANEGISIPEASRDVFASILDDVS